MLVSVLGYLASAVALMTLYRFVYTVIGCITKSKTFPETDNKHTFGIVIAARNESAVIERLMESIEGQDYDHDKYRIFVVADNCTDDTAAICRRRGATVYERHDPQHARKGYALSYLFRMIDHDFGIDCVDGYIIFDADNLLRTNFLTEINKAFDTGAEICIGYRNTKNFSENAVSAAYGIHFMRSSAALHRPRSLLGLSTHIAGTGWAVRSKLIKDGWDCTYLTEDTQFTMKYVTAGYKIEYCEAAEFYDEQPHDLPTAFCQRMRWIKGRLACFFRYALSLSAGIFSFRSDLKTHLSCYDMFFYLFPVGLFTAVCTTFPAIVKMIYDTTAGNAGASAAIKLGETALISLVLYWIFTVFTGIAVVIRERRHVRCDVLHLALYVLLWPWFDLVDIPLSLFSIFRHIEWKPTKHDRSLSIKDVEDIEDAEDIERAESVKSE